MYWKHRPSDCTLIMRNPKTLFGLFERFTILPRLLMMVFRDSRDKRGHQTVHTNQGYSCKFTVIDFPWMGNLHVSSSWDDIFSLHVVNLQLSKIKNNLRHAVNDVASRSSSAISNCYKEVQPQFCPLHTPPSRTTNPCYFLYPYSSSPATAIGPEKWIFRPPIRPHPRALFESPIIAVMYFTKSSDSKSKFLVRLVTKLSAPVPWKSGERYPFLASLSVLGETFGIFWLLRVFSISLIWVVGGGEWILKNCRHWFLAFNYSDCSSICVIFPFSPWFWSGGRIRMHKKETGSIGFGFIYSDFIHSEPVN